MRNAIDDDQQDLWTLDRGEYMLTIVLYHRNADKPNETELVKQANSLITVHSQRDARYLFNQVTDLIRRCKKLERRAASLFDAEASD